MHFPKTLLVLLPMLSPTLALPSTPTTPTTTFISTNANSTLPTPDPYEAVHQAEARLANILDSQKFDSLDLAMTQDAIYDNSALPGGAVLRGLDEIKEALRKAFEGVLVRHDVSHDLIVFEGVGRVRVVTYLIFSRWDPAALDDVSKTFRIWEKCNDIWVLDQGLWKLNYSTVTNMGPKPEAIYWGDEEKN